MSKVPQIMKLGNNAHLNKALSAIKHPSLPTKKLQINIPEALHKQFKLACLSNEVDMTSVVIELVENWLKENTV
ncbi:plasmid partition protein ParG [Providencia manganoxydans]|uniref:plasmid partition protein ParG n=1 Tax=Providencia manganoxydans TaxID=2923283 RepID=UPI0034E4BE8D